MLKPIHPFPARMAPELAMTSLREIEHGGIVLDPMSGSGTVLRHAITLGHRAIGFDMDPLAVLMSRVWTTPISVEQVLVESKSVLKEARSIDLRRIRLPWIDEDSETKDFVAYWFAPTQRRDLRRIAFVLEKQSRRRLGHKRAAALDVLRLALSRIIVTKDRGASLARDVSHSRPHRVGLSSSYDVFGGFRRAVDQMLPRLTTRSEDSVLGIASVAIGDARMMNLPNASVDAVITSPPYLNAIDYLRGHRLALVWLGYDLSSLRAIRSSSIGAERAADDDVGSSAILGAVDSMCDRSRLSRGCAAMVSRYAGDLFALCKEIYRVIKPGGRATFVVGNSCLKNVFIHNSKGLAYCASRSGLVALRTQERELPVRNRYLPMTATGSLSKRMRTECILTFRR